MKWYYSNSGLREGPISEARFKALVHEGVISAQTLVWHEGMANWEPHGGAAPTAVMDRDRAELVTCTMCGRAFPRPEVIQLAGHSYCAACKPLAVQRLREGVLLTTADEEVRKKYLKHEASVQSVGSLYLLGGFGFVFLFLATFSGPFRNIGNRYGAIYLFLGALQLVVGFGVRWLKPWARIPTGILAGLGLLGFPLGTIISGYILYLIFCEKGRMVFSEEYREIIARTPLIKYRTSRLLWIVLIIIIFVAVLLSAGLIFFSH